MSPNHIDSMARAHRQATAHLQAEQTGGIEASCPVVGRWREKCRTCSPESQPKEDATFDDARQEAAHSLIGDE